MVRVHSPLRRNYYSVLGQHNLSPVGTRDLTPPAPKYKTDVESVQFTDHTQ